MRADTAEKVLEKLATSGDKATIVIERDDPRCYYYHMPAASICTLRRRSFGTRPIGVILPLARWPWLRSATPLPGRQRMAQDRTAEVSEAEIAVHWQEEDYIRPPKTFIAQANLQDAAVFDRFSLDKFPECFKEYADLLDWYKSWDVTLDTSHPPFWRWFDSMSVTTASIAIYPIRTRRRSTSSRRVQRARAPFAIFVGGNN
jgi:hypothetical protein